MERRVLVWANNYYGKSLGAQQPVIDVNDPTNEPKILQAYTDFFEKPLAYMLTGNYEVPEDKELLNKALIELSKSKITDWIYIMKYWVDNGFFEYTGDFTKDLNNCIDKTSSEMRLIFATTGIDGTDISLHSHHGRIIGNIPVKLFVYGKNARTRFGNKQLAKIASTLPSRTTQNDRECLISALQGRYLKMEDLIEENITIPLGLNCDVVKSCTAVSPDLPPAGYLEIARALPTSLTSSGKSQLSIIMDYVKSFDVADDVKEYINRILNSETPEAELDDAAVLAYLESKHGLHVDSLSELIVHGKVPQMSMLNLDADLLKGSAEELLNAFKEVEDTELSTLDSIIEGYCAENNISTDCTIKQLIESICCDVHPSPLSAKDIVLQSAKTEGLSMNTTLDEFVKGEVHKDVDDVDVFLRFMQEYKELFPDKVYAAIYEGLMSHEPIVFPTEAPTTVDFLSGKEELVDDDVVKVLEANGVSGDKARDYLKAKLDVDDVVATLCMSGEDTAEFTKAVTNNEPYDILKLVANSYSDVLGNSWLDTVKDATSKNVSVARVMEDNLLGGLAETLNLNSDELSKLTTAFKEGKTYTLQKQVSSDDRGYTSGEYMLSKVREVLSKDASFETRSKYTPILYAFLRMLMADFSKEKADITDFLNTKIKESEPEAKAILEGAKELLM